MTNFIPAATAPRRTIALLGAATAEGAAIGHGIAAAGAVPAPIDPRRPLADALAAAGADALFVAAPADGVRLPGAASVAAAAAATGVVHVVWAAPGGPEARQAFDAVGVPCTRLLAAPTWERLLEPALAFVRDAEDRLALRLPIGTAPVAGIAAADLGAYVAKLFARRTWTAGLALNAAADRVEPKALAAALARRFDEPVALRPLEPGRFATLPGGAALLAQLVAAFEPADVQATRHLLPAALHFDSWVATHAHAPASVALA